MEKPPGAAVGETLYTRFSYLLKTPIWLFVNQALIEPLASCKWSCTIIYRISSPGLDTFEYIKSAAKVEPFTVIEIDHSSSNKLNLEINESEASHLLGIIPSLPTHMLVALRTLH